MFLQAVASACNLSYVDELEGRSQRNIAIHYILPKLVRDFKHRMNRCVNPKFMSFMADYGQYCVAQDRSSGELLMELAMQRVSQGGLSHASYDALCALPMRYWNYALIGDVQCPLDDACVDFLQNNLLFCLENLHNKTWRHHAELIKQGVLVRVSGDNHLLHGPYGKLCEVAQMLY